MLFKLFGSGCKSWIHESIKNPIALHNPTNQKVGYFGAVRISDGRFVSSQEENKFNAETFHSFLKKLYDESLTVGKKVIVILDNAKYHHAKLHEDWRKEHEQKGFLLDFLPPYSPDLNPIERVWKLTRKLCIHNRLFNNIKEIIASLEYWFDSWVIPNQTLQQLCSVA